MTEIFSWKFYNFWFYIEIYDPFRVSFCIWCEIWIEVPHLFFACGYPIFLAPLVERPFFLHWIAFIENKLFIYIWGLFLDSLFYSIHLYIFNLGLHCFVYCSFILSFDIRYWYSIVFVLLLFLNEMIFKSKDNSEILFRRILQYFRASIYFGAANMSMRSFLLSVLWINGSFHIIYQSMHIL